MNAVAPTPAVEEKPFSEAELKIFKRKWDAYQEAMDKVNELLAFLRDQHGIFDEPGWQLGDRGFVRQMQPHAGNGNGEEPTTEKKARVARSRQ